MAITGCNYGVHPFEFKGGLGDSQHVHECPKCGASYIRPGATGCSECSQTPATHGWTMEGQHGVRCEWVCTTHDPPCHKTTYDGKGTCLCPDPLRAVDVDCPQHGLHAPGVR